MSGTQNWQHRGVNGILWPGCKGCGHVYAHVQGCTEQGTIPPGNATEWEPVIALLRNVAIVAILGAALFGCGSAMARYYQGAATTALLGAQCIDILDTVDEAKYAGAKALRAQGDSSGALKMWDDWGTQYKTVKKVCDAAIVGAMGAKATGPIIAAALDRDKQAGAWIARLIKLAADVTAALAKAGIRIPGVS